MRYMPALDGLRALAVLAVMAYHFQVSWARGGYFGVDAFFVLSGFLITSLLLDEHRATGRIDLRAFWARRARRLLPALALVLGVVALYAYRAATPVELHQLRRDGLSTIVYLANWNQIASHVSYFASFGPPSALKHTWSLAIEEQFYLVWPLVVVCIVGLAARRGRDGARLLAGVAGVFAAGSAVLMAVLYHPGHDPSRVYYGTDTRAQSLLAGAVLAVVLARGPALRTRTHRFALHAAAVVAACCLAWIWTFTRDTDGWQYRGGFACAAVLVAIVIASVTRPESSGPLGRVLSWAPLRGIGLISYGLYLWHYPVYVYVSPDRVGLDGGSLLALRTVATFAIAGVSYFLVERPVRRGVLRAPQLRFLVPAAAVALVSALVVSTAGALPVELRSISASSIAAPPAPPPPPSPTARPAGRGARATVRPMRVMLVGDSVAASLSPGLARATAARHELLWNVAVPGCGLATDVGETWVGSWLGVAPNCLPSWRSRWPAEIDLFRPDVVVVLVGTHETFDRRINGVVSTFDSSAGAALATSDLEQAVAILSRRGAHVVFLSTPYYVPGWPMQIDQPRSMFNPSWIDRYNAIERDVVARSGGRASLLDLNRLIDPEGSWTASVGAVQIRKADRMHLSDDGARFVADWLTPQLTRFGPRTVQPGAP